MMSTKATPSAIDHQPRTTAHAAMHAPISKSWSMTMAALGRSGMERISFMPERSGVPETGSAGGRRWGTRGRKTTRFEIADGDAPGEARPGLEEERCAG